METRNDGVAEIRVLQKNLLDLQQYFTEYTFIKYKRQSKQILEDLNKVDFEVENFKLPEILENIPECSETSVIELKSSLKKNIKLFQILIQKKNCPVSKIIDKI